MDDYGQTDGVMLQVALAFWQVVTAVPGPRAGFGVKDVLPVSELTVAALQAAPGDAPTLICDCRPATAEFM